MANKFNDKPHFPFTYGEEIKDDGKRLSGFIVDKLSDKKVQKYFGTVAAALFALGAQAAPSHAIPPEFGEAAVNAAQGVGQQPIPDPGKVEGVLKGTGLTQQDLAMLRAQQAAGNPLQTGPKLDNIPQVPGGRKFPKLIPEAPTSPFWLKANRVGLAGGIALICLNAAWGNPWAAVVCAGALFRAAEGLLSTFY